MTCWALVPIKSRAEGKGRLSGWLGPEERRAIVREMADRVLVALLDARSIDCVAVVTPDRDKVPIDLLAIDDPGQGLNAALDSGRRELIGRGASELVVIHADLPLVTAADVDLLVERGRRTGCALASDAAHSGTNALYLAPPGNFPFRFGADSRRRHLEEAARVGRTVELVATRGLEFDLDRGEDLVKLRAQGDVPLGSPPPTTPGGSWLPQTRFG